MLDCVDGAVAGLVGFHLGIATTMAIGIIPWLNASAVLAFVPASVWEGLEWELLGLMKAFHRN